MFCCCSGSDFFLTLIVPVDCRKMAYKMSGNAAVASRMLLSTILIVSLRAASVGAQLWAATDWTSGAHATFYGGQNAQGTMGKSSMHMSNSYTHLSHRCWMLCATVGEVFWSIPTDL